MTLIGRVVRTIRLFAQQQKRINELEREIRQINIARLREMEGAMVAWRIHMETPEIDLRADVDEAMRAFGDRAAALEEHIL